MPKYLVASSYTAEGAKGLLKEGGSARRATIEKMIKAAGGKLESMYFAFGSDDVYIIADAPDAVTVAALSLAVSAAGTTHTRTIPLLTVEDIDRAAKMTVEFRKPGA